MAVMGGLALAAWRHVRATRDVDLLIGVSEENLEPLLATLTSAGLRPKHQPPPYRSVRTLSQRRLA
jgi:hypothetical protein